MLPLDEFEAAEKLDPPDVVSDVKELLPAPESNVDNTNSAAEGLLELSYTGCHAFASSFYNFLIIFS